MLLRAISSKSGQPTGIGQITLVVGRNNSGKSECLRDIFRLMTGRDPGGPVLAEGAWPRTRVIADLAFRRETPLDELLRGLRCTDRSAREVLVQSISAELSGPTQWTIEPELCRHVLERQDLAAT